MASLGADTAALRLLDGLIMLPSLIALLTAAGMVLLVPVWQKKYWQPAGRLYYTLLVAAGVAFTWLLAFWNLLGSA